MQEISGHIFGEQASKSQPCNLLIKDGLVALMLPGEELEDNICQMDELFFEPPLGSLKRKIKLPDGRIFETDNIKAADSLSPRGFWKNLSRTEKTGWHLVPLAILTPVFAFGLYTIMIPVLIGMGMSVTPDEGLYAIDKSSMRSIDFAMTNPSELTSDRQVEISKIFDNLIEAKTQNANAMPTRSNRDFRYNLNFRSSNLMGPNAFALPGGTIVVTDELVLDFNDDEILAAVLAHEIGHVEHQHSLRQIYRALGMAAMVGLLAGDAGPILEDALLEGSALLSLSHSRKHETESDNYSYDLLKSANYKPDGLIKFFRQLGDLGETVKIETDETSTETTTKRSKSDLSKGEWMSSHPIGETRIKNIEDRMLADGLDLPVYDEPVVKTDDELAEPDL